jgi:hypothetical protein
MSACSSYHRKNTVYPEYGSASMLLFVIGVARLGRFIGFVPAPVIVDFTSGIPLIVIKRRRRFEPSLCTCELDCDLDL